MSCCYSAFELLLLGTWPSAFYQRVNVLSQLLDTYSAFELLLGTWPSAPYHSMEQPIMRTEDRLFDRGWVRSALATRKCGNIYFPKYFMAVRPFFTRIF